MDTFLDFDNWVHILDNYYRVGIVLEPGYTAGGGRDVANLYPPYVVGICNDYEPTSFVGF